MPFYDLKCACGHEFNQKATVSERENKLIKCPQCGSTELEAVYKSVNIIRSKSKEVPACPNAGRCGGCCGH